MLLYIILIGCYTLTVHSIQFREDQFPQSKCLGNNYEVQLECTNKGDAIHIRHLELESDPSCMTTDPGPVTDCRYGVESSDYIVSECEGMIGSCKFDAQHSGGHCQNVNRINITFQCIDTKQVHSMCPDPHSVTGADMIGKILYITTPDFLDGGFVADDYPMMCVCSASPQDNSAIYIEMLYFDTGNEEQGCSDNRLTFNNQTYCPTQDFLNVKPKQLRYTSRDIVKIEFRSKGEFPGRGAWFKIFPAKGGKYSLRCDDIAGTSATPTASRAIVSHESTRRTPPPTRLPTSPIATMHPNDPTRQPRTPKPTQPIIHPPDTAQPKATTKLGSVCSEHNGYCEQFCINNDDGFYCECQEGFEVKDFYFCMEKPVKSSAWYKSTGFVVGVAVGGTCVLLLIVVGVVVCCIRSRRYSSTRRSNPPTPLTGVPNNLYSYTQDDKYQRNGRRDSSDGPHSYDYIDPASSAQTGKRQMAHSDKPLPLTPPSEAAASAGNCYATVDQPAIYQDPAGSTSTQDHMYETLPAERNLRQHQ